MKTVLMSQAQAEWAGRSVAVAGGWIAVGCDRVPEQGVPRDRNTRGDRMPGGIVALVPDSWDTYVREIDREDARRHLLDSVCGEADGATLAATLEPS